MTLYSKSNTFKKIYDKQSFIEKGNTLINSEIVPKHWKSVFNV